MGSPRAVLGDIESALEAGSGDVLSKFHALGVPVDQAVELFQPPAAWSKADRLFFHYVRGTYATYRLGDTFPTRGIRDFETAFPALVGADDASRAARALARMIRLAELALYSLPSLFERGAAMFAKLTWLRTKAPREDVEELDLSLADTLTRMVYGPANDRDSLVRAYGLVRQALSRLFANPPARLGAIPYSVAGLWLDVDLLWGSEDLGEMRRVLGASSTTGRQELRRVAYTKACELEDGAAHRVGARAPDADRRRANLERHLTNLLTQCETLRDHEGVHAAIARWGVEIGEDATRRAIHHAKEYSTPAPLPAGKHAAPAPIAIAPTAPIATSTANESAAPTAKTSTASKSAARKSAATKPAAKKPAATKPAPKKRAEKKSAAKKPAAKKPGAKSSGTAKRR